MQKKIVKLLFKIFLIFLIAPVFAMSSNRGLSGFEYVEVDAVKNARTHSNMGNIYFGQNNYASALKEYQIAYKLTADSAVSSVYLYNMAICFMKLNNYNLAKQALLSAIDKNYSVLAYYDALVDVYIALNEEDKELGNYLSNSSNPYNRIVAGIIYLKTGRTMEAKVIFDEFVASNPDMIITNDIKAILKKITD